MFKRHSDFSDVCLELLCVLLVSFFPKFNNFFLIKKKDSERLFDDSGLNLIYDLALNLSWPGSNLKTVK